MGNIQINKVYNEDCLVTMSKMPEDFIDLTVTSPPYDSLRKYNGFNFDFEATARELYRVTKNGGVVVWITSDATVRGSETGTSFKQALYFKECGFRLYDTMIWKKTGRVPTTDRYYNVFEYMFILSKGKPKCMNFITDHKCVRGGKRQRKDIMINRGVKSKGDSYFIRNEYGRRGNVWKIHNGKNDTNHPAIFPEKLAGDHIITWCDEGDLVYDPFMGSGTTAKMAIRNNRNYIGSEISEEYCQIIEQRLNDSGISTLE